MGDGTRSNKGDGEEANPSFISLVIRFGYNFSYTNWRKNDLEIDSDRVDECLEAEDSDEEESGKVDSFLRVVIPKPKSKPKSPSHSEQIIIIKVGL